ncbi:MAG: DUF3445 domain-containing protein [Rhodobacteraceae bacterium]|nr:DUF3445 domain-containing protein [Paracoccaceae bacterium]
MDPVIQSSIPFDISPRKLPGVQPTRMDEVFTRDDAFAGQMALRDHLLATKRDAVLQMDESARAAALEFLELVLELAYPGSERQTEVQRADGVSIAVNRKDPLATIGQLIQEDVCILQKSADEHVMTGAVLCFPASWMLSEKFMRPLTGIHVPVDSYDASVAARVQRLFDGVQAGRPLWRFNALPYNDPTLHQPRSMHERRSDRHDDRSGYLRSERQTILRLPKSRAVVFCIHTYVVVREIHATVQD